MRVLTDLERAVACQELGFGSDAQLLCARAESKSFLAVRAQARPVFFPCRPSEICMNLDRTVDKQKANRQS